MDIQLAKTFLEIMSAGSFQEAAKRLHVTQTTVTARVKSLEESLGCRLFIRNRAGASLTQEGERFVEHAKNLVFTWQRAKLELSKPSEAAPGLVVGVENSLWNPLLVETINQLLVEKQNIVFDARIEEESLLIKQLDQGLLDAVLVHKPHYRSNFVVELLMEEKLIHVRSTKEPLPNLFIDWGDEFKAQYDAVLPHPRQQGFKTNLGPLALKVMLSQGGNGYFRTRVVQKYLANGELERVVGAPEFSYPVYLLYGEQAVSEALSRFTYALKQQSKTLDYWSV
ncbi:MAG: LysR family transcriptional regulator [Oleispira antarctica]|nr:LysR family transcriptional regulator [Oleispira antarctica]MBQ0791275.1 LysR family transcriptional regulator [Oleispira antarctica]|tara:strand:+ start:1978 stop:2823 length:846 start_codon:yes stop_codon:yes gene_type:complete